MNKNKKMEIPKEETGNREERNKDGQTNRNGSRNR
jgi:hypothetical protein